MSGKWFRTLPSRTTKAEASDNIIAQILTEKNNDQLKVLYAELRRHFSEQDMPLIIESINQEKKVKDPAKGSVTDVYRRFRQKLEQRKKESKKRKNKKRQERREKKYEK